MRAEIERLREALEKAAQIAMDTGRSISDGYTVNHCEHCWDGKIAAANAGYFASKAIRTALEAAKKEKRNARK